MPVDPIGTLKNISEIVKKYNDLKLMKRYRRSITILMVTSFCATASVYAQEVPRVQGPQSRFSLTIKAEETTVKSGSPVWVDVTVQNHAGKDISIYTDNSPDQGGLVYKVDVSDTTGTRAPETQFGRRIQGHETLEERSHDDYTIVDSGGLVILKANKPTIDRVNVSRLYDLSRPGKYKIQFRRFDDARKALVSSNTITVTVTP